MPDPYLLPGTTVLRNLLGIEVHEDLVRAESEFVQARLTVLDAADYERTFRLGHLQAIHAWLFGDLFAWAGQLRSGDYSKDGTEFWPSDTLAGRAARVLGDLAASPLFDRRVDDAIFLDRLAFLYLDLNHLHPFREGNGRAQRVFLNEVAAVSGRIIDWSLTTQRINAEASRRAVGDQSPAPLRELLAELVIVGPVEGRRAAARNINSFRAVAAADAASDVDALIVTAIETGLSITEASERLTALAAERRAVVVRLRDAGLSYADIAARLGVTRSAVQSILK